MYIYILSDCYSNNSSHRVSNQTVIITSSSLTWILTKLTKSSGVEIKFDFDFKQPGFVQNTDYAL